MSESPPLSALAQGCLSISESLRSSENCWCCLTSRQWDLDWPAWLQLLLAHQCGCNDQDMAARTPDCPDSDAHPSMPRTLVSVNRLSGQSCHLHACTAVDLVMSQLFYFSNIAVRQHGLLSSQCTTKQPAIQRWPQQRMTGSARAVCMSL